MAKGQLLGIPNWLKKKIDALEKKFNELFQSVSSGKAKVASAITGKGVTTASDATFDVMAENIGKVVTGKVVYLGTGNSFDVRSICANNGIDYTKLVNGNFISGIYNMPAAYSSQSDSPVNGYTTGLPFNIQALGTGAASHSYNAGTGVLTVTRPNQNIRTKYIGYSEPSSERVHSYYQYANCFAYLVYTG